MLCAKQGRVNTTLETAAPRGRRYDPAETRLRVLEAAYHLFGTRGFANTGTAEIARAAGVSEGSIFYHFRSKQGLLAELGRLHGQKLIAAMQRDDRIEDISFSVSLSRCFEFVETAGAWEETPGQILCSATPNTYQQMKQLPEGEIFMQASREIVVAWTRDHIAAVAEARGVPLPAPEVTAALIFASVKEALNACTEPGISAGQRKAICAECVRFCSHAVGIE